MFLHNTKEHEAMPTAFVAIKAIEKQKQEMHCNQNEIDLKTNRYRNKKGFKIKKLNEISLKIYNTHRHAVFFGWTVHVTQIFPRFFPFSWKRGATDQLIGESLGNTSPFFLLLLP